MGLLGDDVGEDAGAGEDDAGPALGVEGVSLGEDGEEDGEDLAGGGDGGGDEGVEVGDGVEDEGLSEGGAGGKADDVGEDGGVGDAEGDASEQLAADGGEEEGGEEHVDVCEEHPVVGLGDEAALLGLELDAFLDAAGEAVEDEGGDDEGEAGDARLRAGRRLLLGEGDDGRAAHDRGDLGVLAERVRRAAEDEGAHHDGDHLPRLGERRDREAHAVREGGVRAVLGRDLRRAGAREQPLREPFRPPRRGEPHEPHRHVEERLAHLQEPHLPEPRPVRRRVSEHVLLQRPVVQERRVDPARPEQQLHRARRLHRAALAHPAAITNRLLLAAPARRAASMSHAHAALSNRHHTSSTPLERAHLSHRN
mmetsp:Transcript_1926/g.5816  ORF Transcript_1926/g.5816 Transcript_1926/m.5816 type:complete len:366 (+) Transcript_1926:2107-3204(+)